MNTQIIVGGVAITAILLGGYLYLAPADMAGEEAMMQKDAMMKDEAMMQKDGASMEEADAMMDDTSMDSGAMMETKDAMKSGAMMEDAMEGAMQSGSYEEYAPEKIAMARDGDVVLFFYAAWCPSCRPVDAALQQASIPKGLTILRVNYDTETALKQKYGVTYQHTFVQVDAEGGQITKWSGGSGLSDIVARVK